MSELVTNFISSRKLENSPQTIRAYESDLLRFIMWCEEKGIDPLKIETRFLRTYLNSDLIANKGKNKGNPISNRSRARIKACLSSFYRFLKVEGIISENPIENLVIKFKISKQEPEALTKDEIWHLREIIKENKEYVSIFEFLLGTGAREAEACSLRWSRVYPESGSVVVVGKGGNDRRLFISRKIVELLSSLDRSTEFVFTNKNKKPYTPSMVYYRIHKLTKFLTRESIHPHLLRHTFATHMAEGRPTMSDIQKQLGHKDISTTAIYVHGSSDAKARYDETVENI